MEVEFYQKISKTSLKNNNVLHIIMQDREEIRKRNLRKVFNIQNY